MNKDELEGRIILRLPPYPALVPQNVLEAISTAIAFVKKEPVALSINDINVYKLTWTETKVLAGFCFAICIDQMYYAVIVGSNMVISFSEKTFLCEQCSCYEIPLRRCDKVWYYLVVEYGSNQEAHPLELKKNYHLNNNDGEVLLKFNKNTAIREAIEKCYNHLDKM